MSDVVDDDDDCACAEFIRLYNIFEMQIRLCRH